MNHFGYFHTESSHHASEYLPYFRKTPELVQAFIPERWDYYQICCGYTSDSQESLMHDLLAELKPSLEYGTVILNAVATNVLAVIYGNVPNAGPPATSSRCRAWSTRTVCNPRGSAPCRFSWRP